MSAPLIYMKIHHNLPNFAPRNAHPHLIQPLPQVGLACLFDLTEMDYPFTRSDVSNNTQPTVKTAATAIGLFSIAFGLHLLKNNIMCFNTLQNRQQDVQCLNTGKKYQTFETAAFKPLRRAVPFVAIWSPSTSTSQRMKSARLVQKVFPRDRSFELACLVLPSTSVQQAATPNREASSSTGKGITSSRKATLPLSPARLAEKLAFNVPGLGESQKKMTKNPEPTTSGAIVVSHGKTRAPKSHGKGDKQGRNPVKPRKRFNRRRRTQPRAAKHEVEEKKSGVADLVSEGQHPEGNVPESQTDRTGNLGDMAQTNASVGREVRRAPRKSRSKRRKNVTPSREEVKDGAPDTQATCLLPLPDVNKLAKDAEKCKEEGSKLQACIHHEGAHEAMAKRNNGSKSRKHRRAKKTDEKAPNQIGEQHRLHAQSSTTVNEMQHELSEARENAVGPPLFLPGHALNQNKALCTPQVARLSSSGSPEEVRKSPRFSSQDARNDVSSRHIVKRRWKPRRGQMKH